MYNKRSNKYNVKSTILEIKSKYDVTEAGSTLLLAEEAFNEGNYSKAKKLALKAKSPALGIDQDGIPNEEDFTPYIKNEYIYIGIRVLILLIIVGILTIPIQKRKKVGKNKNPLYINYNLF